MFTYQWRERRLIQKTFKIIFYDLSFFFGSYSDKKLNEIGLNDWIQNQIRICVSSSLSIFLKEEAVLSLKWETKIDGAYFFFFFYYAQLTFVSSSQLWALLIIDKIYWAASVYCFFICCFYMIFFQIHTANALLCMSRRLFNFLTVRRPPIFMGGEMRFFFSRRQQQTSTATRTTIITTTTVVVE